MHTVGVLGRRGVGACVPVAAGRKSRPETPQKLSLHAGSPGFPGHDFAVNAAWLLVVGLAADLTAWTQGLCLTGELARCEPKRLRYCVWHAAGRLVHTGRRLILRLDAAWPWATEIAAAFERLEKLSFST